MFAMKTIVLSVVFSLLAAAPLLADDTVAPTNETTQASYALGMLVGEMMKDRGATNMDMPTLVQGLRDAESGGPTRMTVPEMRATWGAYQAKLAQQQEVERTALGEKNLKMGEDFLARTKSEDGVVTLPDGLEYKIIAAGSGPSPANDDTVTVSYEGTLVDGTVFDKSDNATFPVGAVIPGWSEALLRMKAGAEWKLFIPSRLAYGPNGRMPKIEPNSALIFDVHLLSIQHPQPLTSDIIKVPSAEEMKNGAKVEIIKPEDVQKMRQQQSQGK